MIEDCRYDECSKLPQRDGRKHPPLMFMAGDNVAFCNACLLASSVSLAK